MVARLPMVASGCQWLPVVAGKSRQSKGASAGNLGAASGSLGCR